MDGSGQQPVDYYASYQSMRAETRRLREAILELDLGVSHVLPGCDPECYKAHRAHTPLVPLATVAVDVPLAHWMPSVEVAGDVRLAVGLADRIGTGSVLTARVQLEHVARQDTHTAYFQRQTEHLYRMLNGPDAGAWVIAVREAEYGPVDLLIATWMIVPVHRPAADPDLGPRVLQAVDELYRSALAEERQIPWTSTEQGRDARLPEARSQLIRDVVHTLIGQAEPGLPDILQMYMNHRERNAITTAAREGAFVPERHPTHPCSASRTNGKPCRGRAIGGDPPLCYFHANTRG